MICRSKNVRVGDRFEAICKYGCTLQIGDVLQVTSTGLWDWNCINLRTMRRDNWNLLSKTYFKRVP